MAGETTEFTFDTAPTSGAEGENPPADPPPQESSAAGKSIPAEQVVDQIVAEAEETTPAETEPVAEQPTEEGPYGRYKSLDALLQGHENAQGVIDRLKGATGTTRVDDAVAKLAQVEAINSLLRSHGYENPLDGLAQMIGGDSDGISEEERILSDLIGPAPVTEKQPPTTEHVAPGDNGVPPETAPVNEQQVRRQLIERFVNEGATEAMAQVTADSMILTRRLEKKLTEIDHRDQMRSFEDADQRELNALREKDPDGFKQRKPYMDALMMRPGAAGAPHWLLNLAAAGVLAERTAREAHDQGLQEADALRRTKTALATRPHGESSGRRPPGMNLNDEERALLSRLKLSPEKIAEIEKLMPGTTASHTQFGLE